MSKDIWIAHYTDALNDLEEQGVENADEIAAQIAQQRTADTYADMIDYQRMVRKERDT